MVQIGFQTYKTKTFIPLPTRCWRCQRFGHAESSCRGKVTCPRCAKNHKYEDCPIISIALQRSSQTQDNNAELHCVNCKENHSAAYRGCPEYIKNKDIAKIKTLFKLSYADAAKQLKEKEEAERHRQSERAPTSEARNTQETREINQIFQDRIVNPPVFQPNPCSSFPLSSFPSLPSHICPLLTTYIFPPFTIPTSTPTHSNPPPLPSNPPRTPTSTSSSNPPPFSTSNPAHLDIFITKLLILIIDLLSSYLSKQSIVIKLNNFITKLATLSNLDQITIQSFL